MGKSRRQDRTGGGEKKTFVFLYYSIRQLTFLFQLFSAVVVLILL